MANDTYFENRRITIESVQKRIKKGQVKLFSMAMLVIVPLIAALAAFVASASHTPDSPGESAWFPTELSTGSILLVMAIWTVPLLLIIKANHDQINADRVLLLELQQEFPEESL